MAVRFYVDADLLGLARILADARSDVTYPGDPGGVCRDGSQRPPCPITSPQTDDEVWLPTVCTLGWLIITKDRKIKSRPAEVNAVREHGGRMVALRGAKAKTLWGQLELVVPAWHRLEDLTTEPGPFIHRLTGQGLTKQTLA
jgi:hypothetical protein